MVVSPSSSGTSSASRVLLPPAAVASLLLVLAAASLVAYKASAALATLARVRRTGVLAPKAPWVSLGHFSAWTRPFAATVNYLGWVLIALTFGVLLGAMVRAFVPARWLRGTVAAGGARAHLLAALAGAPLMLCSCCVAPLFDGVYARTRRLGPSLGLMFAAPGLNPAALALTFVLFPRDLALGRLLLSLLLVLLASALLGRAFDGAAAPTECSLDAPAPTFRGLARGFASALRDTALQSLPAITLGVLVSVLVAEHLPLAALVAGGRLGVVLAVAAVAVLLALPTFGELPLGVALLAAGAPRGAVLALLVAGPVINLPSLLTLRRAVSARAALATGAVVFTVASAGALLLGD